MTDPSASVADLAAAATRVRDLSEEVVVAVVRAEALARETQWQARAAMAFQRSMRAWCADLTDVRTRLDDLADEVVAAAGDARHRLELLEIGATR